MQQSVNFWPPVSHPKLKTRLKLYVLKRPLQSMDVIKELTTRQIKIYRENRV
jgi:hypothetical protein